jgi:FMN-dependent oxidoreductase (nitrilotriacetate monooxygenase family)
MSQLRERMHIHFMTEAAGAHHGAWRRPDVPVETVTQLSFLHNFAQIAERGKLDGLFLADGVAFNASRAAEAPADRLEPVSMLSAIAAMTTHLGLIGSVSTSYSEPYNLARQLGTLDHLSGGRAGWNIVTTAGDAAARNFSLQAQPSHADRYERAAEFVDVCRKLWLSWDADAVLNDKAAGRFADPSKIHALRHKGKHFSVEGPLNFRRPPQGTPILAQAGSSHDGIAFAAQWAEMVFTAQKEKLEARDFVRRLRAAVAGAGRDPAKVLVIPGICPIIGSTMAEARRIQEEMDAGLSVVPGIKLLESIFGQPGILDAFKPTDQVPDEVFARGLEVAQGRVSRLELMRSLNRRPGITLGDIGRYLNTSDGHWVVPGTPESIADQMQEWFEFGAADGFVVMAPYLPVALELFVDEVVPILQRRGLFRTEYEAVSLRERYGLPVPK